MTAYQRSPLLRAARIVGINLVVLAVLLLGIEGCVRLANPEIQPLGTDADLVADSMFYEVPGPRPGAAGRSNGAHFVVSDRGFWHYGANRDTAAAAWLLLGDSVTMGIGVEPRRTFAGLLEDRSRARAILNPSLIGYASDDYVTVLQAVLERHSNVRRATIFWCLNDAYAGIPSIDDPNQSIRQIVGPVLAFVHRRVFTYQWLKAHLFDRPRRYYEHDAALYRDEHLDAAVGDLERIGEICERADLTCELVLMPYEYQLRIADREEAFQPQAILKARVNHSALSVYDPSAYLLNRHTEASNLFQYGDGIHLSEEGHRLMADYVSELSQ